MVSKVVFGNIVQRMVVSLLNKFAITYSIVMLVFEFYKLHIARILKSTVFIVVFSSGATFLIYYTSIVHLCLCLEGIMRSKWQDVSTVHQLKISLDKH